MLLGSGGLGGALRARRKPATTDYWIPPPGEASSCLRLVAMFLSSPDV